MAEAANLQIVISAQDLASAKLKEVQAQSETMGKSFEKAGSSITSAGHTLLPFSAAAGVGLGLAVHAAENFNQQMLLIQTQAGGSAQEVSNLTSQVLKLAPAVGQSPQELAKALFFVESAGFRGAQAMDILKLSAEGAAVGQADLSETTKVLTSLMADHIQGAENATVAMGNLNAIVGAGKMTFNDLNAAMATGIGATAGAFGVSLQSVGAALAALTNKGVPAVDAASHLRMLMLTMELPTTTAAKALEAMGLTTTDAGNRTAAMADIMKKSGITTSQLAEDLKKPNGISVALADLKQRLMDAGASSSDASAVIEKSLGGIRAGNTAVMLANDLGSVNDRFAQIGRTAGDFNNSWAAQQDQAKQKMADFKASISVLEIQLGNAFLPVLDDLVKHISKIVDAFERLNPSQQKVITEVLLFTAVLAPTLIMVGKVIKSVTLLGEAFMFVATKMGIVGALSKGGLGLSGLSGLAGTGAKAVTAAGAVGVGGEAVAGTEAVGGMAGLAAILGPVALGIGAIALAAGVGYLAYKKFTELGVQPAAKALSTFNQTAKDVGYSVTTTGPKIDMLTLAQTHAKDATNILNSALTNNSRAQSASITQQQILTQKTNDYHDAQTNAQKVLAQFGSNSPQYQAAAQNVSNKYYDLANALNDTARSSLNVTIQGGILANAQKVWRDATYSLGLTQIALNNYLNGGVGIIAKFGPMASLQVGAIDVLHAHIAGVVAAWNGLVVNIQGQNPILNASLQGLGSTLNRVQGQSTVLNASLSAANSSAATLQNAGFNPQHRAGGGPVSAMQSYIIGEEGPELFIPGSNGTIIPNNKSSTTNNSNSKTITINSVYLTDQSAVKEFFNQLDRDNILVSKGLTPARGT